MAWTGTTFFYCDLKWFKERVRNICEPTYSCVVSGFRRDVDEFWDITQRRVVILYGRFGTADWFHLQ
jgi:hypothetical protein